MPLYEYECEAQHHRFELIRKFSDPPITICPTCGSPVHKLMSAPAFQLKGTGWYITDYAKKDGGSGTAPKSESKDKDTTGSSEKTEKTEKSDKSEKSDKAESAPKSEASPTPSVSKSDT